MKLYPFQAIYPNTDLIASAESFFDTARNDFSQYYANGFFRETAGPAFYIMEIRTGDKIHTGLIACLDVADYSKGKIVRHEETIASHEQVMLKVLLQRGSMVKPVLVAHAPDKAITKEIARLKKKHRPFVRMATTAEGLHRRRPSPLQHAGETRAPPGRDARQGLPHAHDGHLPV